MRYCFAVIYPGDAADPQLLVCGSVRELGTWNVDHAVAMTSATSFCTQEMSFWQVTVSIDDDDHSDEASAFFYKYVIRYNKGTVLWEGRDELDNRSYRRQQCDLVDGVYLIPTSFWNYTMAVTTGTNTDHGSWHQLSMTLFYHNICSEQSINFSKVSDKIYFGSCPRKFYHVAVLKSLGISAVLTLQTEADLAEHCRPLFYSSPCCDHELVFKLQTLYRHQGIAFVWLPVKAMSTEHRILMLPQAVLLLTSLLSAGHRRVYVCCNAGIGRSAAVVAAYLMCVEKMTFRQTEHFLYARRPIVYVDEVALKTVCDEYQAIFDRRPPPVIAIAETATCDQ